LKFGLSIVPNKSLPTIIEQVKLAEREGFQSAWIADVGLHREAFLTCALASQGTTKIHIGTGVVNPYTRHPGIIASQTATLQEISQGRAFLGLGAGGYRALRQLGIATWDRPALTLRESVKILRALLDGQKLTFHGSVFSVDNAQIDFRYPAPVPIYLGVMQGKMALRIAGELCDGVILVGPLGKQTGRIIDAVREAAIDSGRDPGRLDIALTAPFAVSDNRSAAIEAVKRTVAELAITDDRLKSALQAEGITEEGIWKVKGAIQRGENIEAAVGDEMVDLFGIAGTPSDCIDKINSLEKAGVTQIVVGRPAQEIPEMLKVVGENLIANLHE
jgi:5,10-methylenetetrahydromethanopterin reductase